MAFGGRYMLAGIRRGGAYTNRALLRQAAGFAYGWRKINGLEGISGIQWHNWFDNDGDGVQLGLRKYGDDRYGAEENGKAKPVWNAFQNAGTASETEYFKNEFNEYFTGNKVVTDYVTVKDEGTPVRKDVRKENIICPKMSRDILTVVTG